MANFFLSKNYYEDLLNFHKSVIYNNNGVSEDALQRMLKLAPYLMDTIKNGHTFVIGSYPSIIKQMTKLKGGHWLIEWSFN